MLLSGTTLQGRYRIIRQIGRGGMGHVYQAFDTRLDVVVAVKQTFAQTEKTRRAFEAEAHLLARLRHDALPRVTDHFTESDGVFLVMEFIEGDDLGTLLSQRQGSFSVDEVLAWAERLLDALHYLHAQNPPVIHRDIKPQNLKLTPEGVLYLLDFGLARGAQGTLISGYTEQYAPIEQFQGLGTDARGDLYSLGATLHQLLTNTAPQGATTRAAAVVGKQPDPQPPAYELNPQVPPVISDVLEKAMAIRAEDRYASAADMRKALQQGAVSSASQKTIVLSPPAAPRRVRVKPIIILMAFIGVAIFLFVLGLTTSPRTCSLREGSRIEDIVEIGANEPRKSERIVNSISDKRIEYSASSVSIGMEESRRIAYGTVPFLSRAVFDELLGTGSVSVYLIDRDVEEDQTVELFLEEKAVIPMKFNEDSVDISVVEAISDKGDRVVVLNNRQYPLLLEFDVRTRRQVWRKTVGIHDFNCYSVWWEQLRFW
jgi:serine/threonine protein kinase